MRKPVVVAIALWWISGCGDGRDSHRDYEGTGGAGGGSSDGVGASGGNPDPVVGVGPSASSAAATAGSGGNQGGGISCAEIWACYGGCNDTNCTAACYEQGSDAAQTADEALWRCIFTNCDWHCAFEQGCDSDPCVQQKCTSESQACFGG